MKINPIDSFLMRAITLLAMLVVSSGVAWAASAGCDYTGASAPGGTGMGGTGIAAEGSGIGGTGISPESPAGKEQLAGNVIFSQGAVEAQSQGRTRPLAKGSQVCVGETIVTSSSGKVQIRMADGGLISIRPETKIRIDVFHFNGKEDGTERSEIALLEGGFRALTGMIGHVNKENYKIHTSNAQIGIRGTDHEPMYIPNPAPGQTAVGVPGTYDKVNSGGVVISTPQGAVEVKPNQAGFVPNEPGALPVILKEIPRFYQAGTEPGFRAAERHGGSEASREPAEHSQAPERGQGAEMHAPEPPAPETKTPETKTPEVRIPEMQTPEVHGPED